MTRPDLPSSGGSYLRDKDGSLKRVNGTKPAGPAAKPKPAKQKEA